MSLYSILSKNCDFVRKDKTKVKDSELLEGQIVERQIHGKSKSRIGLVFVRFAILFPLVLSPGYKGSSVISMTTFYSSWWRGGRLHL